jgi:hypothetical protein
MNRIIIASEILKIAKELMAMEFDTEEEKKKYQQEHEVRPGTKLTVKKTDKKPQGQPSVQKPSRKQKQRPPDEVVFKEGSLSVRKNGVYGISCDVHEDPKMSKTDFVNKHQRDVDPRMKQFDLERGVIGTITGGQARKHLDRAFRSWVEGAIERGEKISEKTMKEIDIDDSYDDFGKMWDIEDEAKKAGYVLKDGYYEKSGK